MGVMFIINAPWVFSTIWSFIKMWMDEVTVKKIIIISAGKDFKKELEAFVDLTGIPQNILKGTGALKGCECEGGCMNSDKGPWNVKGKEEA